MLCSMKTTKEELQNVCSDFGVFTDIILPPSKKMPKRIAGFAFVQFKTREAAEKAKDYFNSNKFHGRMVAADWALPKDTYETAAQEEREQLKKKVKLEQGEDDANLKEEKPELSKTKKFEKPSVSTLNSDDEGGEDDEEMSDEEVDAESDSDEVESGSEGDDDHGNRKEEDEEESEEESDEDRGENKKDSAIDENRVVFLRNLSFDTTNETLRAEMEQFGEVKLALCCKFRDSGHPKGTAFVHFSTSAEARACLEATERGLEIDGRQISGSLAIQRENAAEIQKRKSVKV
ncbi:unnamed protein product [Strongylus vulgaris]|uniref:RRM domain-containing protein n=1 Tax=Strongylus vulgaris TaxID=40348 RepID=A0A3P7JDL1_STRVU|nr:unnamed protein product [Strongylus vulgaris]